MTQPPPNSGTETARELLVATQVDRDAAAALWDAMRNATKVEWQSDWMRDGTADSGPVVQAFARHRLSTLPSSPLLREGLEAAWRDGWNDCKAVLTEDEAFCLTADVEEDAWLESKTAALASKSLPPTDDVRASLVAHRAELEAELRGRRIGTSTRPEYNRRRIAEIERDLAELEALATPSLPEGMR